MKKPDELKFIECNYCGGFRERYKYERNGIWTEVPEPNSLKVTIRNALLNALAFTNGNVKKAADALNIPRTTMLSHMDEYNIPRIRPKKEK